ncbi:MAG: exodeoxyribonuclease VII small subunit [Vulcanimicrobiaceae bacterium]
MATEPARTFEALIGELEGIVKALESGNQLGLDQAVKLFSKGKALARKAQTQLERAESEIALASGQEPGIGAPSASVGGEDDEIPF